mgnify:CR=1 FL=1
MASFRPFAINFQCSLYNICRKSLSLLHLTPFNSIIFLNAVYLISGKSCQILIQMSFNSSQIECLKHTFVRAFFAFLWRWHHPLKSFVHFSIGPSLSLPPFFPPSFHSSPSFSFPLSLSDGNNFPFLISSAVHVSWNIDIYQRENEISHETIPWDNFICSVVSIFQDLSVVLRLQCALECLRGLVKTQISESHT